MKPAKCEMCDKALKQRGKGDGSGRPVQYCGADCRRIAARRYNRDYQRRQRAAERGEDTNDSVA